jgi:hypothetical protein
MGPPVPAQVTGFSNKEERAVMKDDEVGAARCHAHWCIGMGSFSMHSQPLPSRLSQVPFLLEDKLKVKFN